jgi:small subunit ribosomal protein S21e
MQNEEGINVDLYIPRRCSYTNRLIESKDHASVQINVANVDPVTGITTGDQKTFCLAGFIRFKSESDMALTSLVSKADAAMMANQGES